MNTTTASLYELDFYRWIQHQVETLRGRKFSELDLENLIEEMEAVGRSEKRSLIGSLSLVLMHLIKWQYQPDLRSKSWMFTIRNQRDEVIAILEDSPSLKSFVETAIERAWKKALIEAEKETGIENERFPPTCPWTFDEFMNDNFWPDIGHG